MNKRIKLEHLNNTRDLGGMLTKEGYAISKNRLLRSGELFATSPRDIDILLDNKLCEVIDLRTSEKNKKTNPFIQNLHLSVLNAGNLVRGTGKTRTGALPSYRKTK